MAPAAVLRWLRAMVHPSASPGLAPRAPSVRCPRVAAELRVASQGKILGAPTNRAMKKVGGWGGMHFTSAACIGREDLA